MAAGTNRSAGRRSALVRDPLVLRCVLTALALAFLGLFLLMPVAVVLGEALKGGLHAYWAALRDTEALAAMRLTLLITVITVPLNGMFGLAAAWSIARFRYPGKDLLITLIDLPFCISPVIVGMMVVLLFGANNWVGGWLEAHGLKVVFAVPGMVLATLFVTFPLVARELIPFLQSTGDDEEQAAIVLGATGWQTFLYVTLPSIKWSLIYGVLLCTARAMGEFGAVSVVSGHIRGLTNTVPLHVEILYDEYCFSSAFAVASVLLVPALVTLVARKATSWESRPSPSLAAEKP